MAQERVMHPNSLRAYQSIHYKLSASQARVLAELRKFGRATLEQIARALNTDVNCISGRFTELSRANIIKVVGRVRNSKGNRADVYAPASAQPLAEEAPVIPPPGPAAPVKKKNKHTDKNQLLLLDQSDLRPVREDEHYA